MKERPILFSAPMVKAILEGRKTQTRRVVMADRYRHHSWQQGSARPSSGHLVFRVDEKWGASAWDAGNFPIDPISVCPYGKPGDRLWVRESLTLGCVQREAMRPIMAVYQDSHGYMGVEDKMAPDAPEGSRSWCLKWKRVPSIHMPRWASRITLEITNVRVERVQEISYEDALAEGVMALDDETKDLAARFYGSATRPVGAVDYFRLLWNKLNNGRDLGWDKNPWVWALSFKRIEKAAVAA